MRSLLLSIALMFTGVQAQAMLINGAGASFPYPIYSKWFAEYQKNQPDVRINYQSIGSGAGVRQVIAGTVDFGASDSPLKAEERAKSTTPLLNIPTVMGAVTISYNLPDLQGELKLTPQLLADIFLGKITRWDDEQLTALNPDLHGAAQKQPYILVVQRSDGSGTTAIFTEYLSMISDKWSTEVGQGKSVAWPTGLGGKGNEGVGGVVKQNPGAIGYVELTFALSNQLDMALLQNAAGQFVKPTLESVIAAAKNVQVADDLSISLLNSKVAEAYPITAATYMLVPQRMSREKGEKITRFLDWAMGEGQELAAGLHYARLPEPVVKKIKASLQTIQLH